MDAVESELVALKEQLADQAAQIARLSTELGQLQTRQPWQPLETFHLFPKLPIELRREIWRFALPDPRLLTLRVPDVMQEYQDDYEALDIDRAGDEQWDLTCAFGKFMPETPLAEASALHYVCKESREVAVMEEDFCMSTFVPPGAVIGASMSGANWIVNHEDITYRGFRFQPARDTVYVKEHIRDDTCRFDFCRPTEIKTNNIRSLALLLPCFLYGEESLSTWLSLLFSKLEQLILIAHEDDSEEVRGGFELNISEGREAVQSYVRKEMQERPNTRIPLLRVMTEKMLAKYVSDMHLPERWRDSRFQPLKFS